ncbi:MAG: PDZ domain-containing protein [Tannerella sp.]|jgi:tricorn protease|nr:PDZ domain-containing protein [Tannerella sp.]
MNGKILFLLIVTALSAGTLRAADEARLLRFPATNGSEIVFTHAGDLYRVPLSGGEAVRLTSHVGYEMFARFSPDGRTIAFTGQYDGNTEVYSIPAEGGEPLRLTYTSTNARDDLGDRMGPNNIVMTWTADGRRIVYRNRISGSFTGRLLTVDRDGGLSTPIPLPEGGFCSYSPDGKRLAYNRVMREFRTWKYYRGGMADDVWIYDPEKASVENVTKNDAQDIFPMWIGDEIYFLSDRDRTMNVFAYNTRTGATEKVTHFSEYDVKFPSTDGHIIVFENGGYIYRLDPSGRQAEKVRITLASDHIHARSEVKNGSEYVTHVSLSPDGERLSVTSRGEVFDLPVERGVTKNITRTAGAHERAAQWSPDGETVAYISDATGETEIYLYRPRTGVTTQLTRNSDTYIRTFEWSPDSRTIACVDRRNRLQLIDLSSGQRTTLFADPYGEPRGVAFSPDSRWLTYTRTETNTFSVVYIYDIARKTQHAVTDRWYESSSPVFSTDGKYLVFRSMRDFTPVYGAMEWNHIFRNESGVYLALLSNGTPSPFLARDGRTPSAEAKTAADDATKRGGAATKKDDRTAAAAPAVMHVDTDGLSGRIVKIPVAPGFYTAFHSDGKKVYYARAGSTFAYDLEAQKEDVVAEGAVMTVGAGRRRALFTRGRGHFFVADIPQGKATLKDEVNLGDMKITTDYAREWAQVFDEAWRAFRDGFYVENMHGVDWAAMKAKYAVLLPHVRNRIDLNYVIGEMIGELQCGHAYITAGETKRPERIRTGLLGAEISRHESGCFRIDRILPGVAWNAALRSPLDEPGVDVHEGEYIIAVDGIPAGSVNDLYALLAGKAGVATELTVGPHPQADGARRRTVVPLDSEYPLRHHEWVQRNIEKVDKASGGRIGYIYIPDMGPEGLVEFSRLFYPQLDKEGLIVDDRANGGGNVSPMILERLAREPYRLTMSRGSARISTIPDAVQTGPKVCLVDKYSASDGDLFPWGFRALGLGPIIGTRTWGGIVGISSSLPFIDGTDLRVPFFTSYDPATGDWIIENHGVDPDIVVDNDPVREWNGEDQQLDRAILEVMNRLGDRRPLPPVPAPRVWNR